MEKNFLYSLVQMYLLHKSQEFQCTFPLKFSFIVLLVVVSFTCHSVQCSSICTCFMRIRFYLGNILQDGLSFFLASPNTSQLLKDKAIKVSKYFTILESDFNITLCCCDYIFTQMWITQKSLDGKRPTQTIFQQPFQVKSKEMFRQQGILYFSNQCLTTLGTTDLDSCFLVGFSQILERCFWKVRRIIISLYVAFSHEMSVTPILFLL